MPHPTRPPRSAAAAVGALAALLLAACGSSSSSSPPSTTTPIVAATGGTATLDSGAVTVTILPGALSADASVTITEVTGAPAAGAGQTAASKAYRISLAPAGVTLSQPMTVAITATSAPVHPQLGEIATLSGGTWTRLGNGFVRPPRTVLSLSSNADATYRVTFRTLAKVDPASASAVEGFGVYMYETFGNEEFFTTLGLASLLNVVKPTDAVALGVQVDLDKVPVGIRNAMLDDTPDGLIAKEAALGNAATTIALVKAGAVVGVVDKSPPSETTITRVGITCALCHQLVTPNTFRLTDRSVTLPIGPLKVDGKPNLAMDSGTILSLTAGGKADPVVEAILDGWKPGFFDVRTQLTANTTLDDEVDNPTITPPLWNFVDLEAAGYAYGWDGLFFGDDALASQAEAVYHLVMNGAGAFAQQPGGAITPALRVPASAALLAKLEGAASATPLITAPKLLALQAWMRSITSPAPGAFDAAQAEEGWRVFNTRGCTGCHSTPELSGTSLNITVIPGSTGDLAGGIRVPSLRGLTSVGPPYFHDGRMATLAAAVAAMSGQVGGLTPAQQAQVVEYLKSL